MSNLDDLFESVEQLPANTVGQSSLDNLFESVQDVGVSGELHQSKPASSTITDRFDNIIEKRRKEATDVFESYNEGGISLGSAMLQIGGKAGAGTFMDLVGETVATGVGAVAEAAGVKEPILQYMSEVMGKAYNSDIGKQIKTEWDKLSPEAQKNLEATGNIASVILPKVKLGKVGDVLTSKANMIRRSRLAKVLELPKTVKNDLAKARRAFNKPYNFDDMVTEVSKVRGVSANRSLEKNIISVEKGIGALDKKLFKELRQADGVVAPSLIDDILDKHMKAALDENVWIQSNKAIASGIDDNIKAMRQVLGQFEKTPQGVILARRKFDGLLKDKIFELTPEELIARDGVSKIMRNVMNDVAQAAAPTARVKELLKRQSLLYQGWDNLAENYARTPEFLKVLGTYAKNHPSFIPGVGTSGTAAGIMTALANPEVVAPILAGVAAVGGVKAFPTALKLTGKAAKAVGRGLKDKDGMLITPPFDKIPISSTRAGLFFGDEEQNQ